MLLRQVHCACKTQLAAFRIQRVFRRVKMTENPQSDNNPHREVSIEELNEFLADVAGVEVVEPPQNSDE